MKYKILVKIIFTLIIFSFAALLHAQSKEYKGPDDPAGDPAAEREVHMDGNRWQIYLNNTGYTGHWGYLDGSKWPRTSEEGLDMYDGLRLVVGGKVYVEQDSIIVTDPGQIAYNPNLEQLYIVESNASSETDPDGIFSWALTPVFGYFNELSESPAISIDPNSWPLDGWPKGDVLEWQGEWNGRFGRGVQYAQLESYYVMNDAQDQEWIQPAKKVKYYPRRTYDNDRNIIKDVRIGDKRPNVTTQKDLPWGGLGLRVETRGYQWNNPQTRDAVFWEYNIANISEYDLTEVIFGFMMDLGIGHYILSGDGEDDVGSFNDELDLSFCWDTNGTGNFGYNAGTLGFAFLESPGAPNDNIDNDNDGLIDEKRDNLAETFYDDPLAGITNVDAFLQAYGIKSVDDLKPHWDADEDQDWNDGIDANENGEYDSGEDYGDDVGLDGVAPGDLNYNGPDADGTECNHKPDMDEGKGMAEPNFGLTDVSESDMYGLQSFHLFQHPQGRSPSPAYDEDCFKLFADQTLDDYYSTPNNLYQTFGTGPFRLDKGRTERISMATIAAYENLDVLTDDKIAPIIFDRKKVVQLIYESDYRFAKPPEMPTLRAVGSDGKVILSWDNRADQLTREPLTDGENDFEGYKLYKSTERNFIDALLLRDGFGNPAGLAPERQWDLKNNYFGHTEYATVEGEGFFLGYNTGIQHYYIDEKVQNGRTYYYYLAAYDHGIEEKNIAPSENVPTITVNENEEITFLSPNVQVVTPRARAAGFADAAVEIIHDPEDIAGPAELLSVDIVDPTAIKENHIYKMVFKIDTVETLGAQPKSTIWGHYFVDIGLKIYDATIDSLVYIEDKENPIQNHIIKYETAGSGYGNNIVWDLLRTDEPIKTNLFDGIQVTFELPLPEDGLAYFDSLNSGWFTGGQGFMNLTVYKENIKYYPYKYDLIFTGENETYTSKTTRRGKVGFGTGTTVKSGQYILGETFHFYVEDKAHRDENGENLKLDLMAVDMNDNDQFDLMEDEIYAGFTDFDPSRNSYTWARSLFSFNFKDIPEDERPKPGDIYRVNSVSPFTQTDTLRFRVLPYDLDSGPLKEENLKNITVVPNPYVVTNTLEPAVRHIQFNQKRRLMFTNIPAQCTIKIFTMSGYFVKKIEVNNSQDYGMAYWDLLTRENLEAAAGIYLYHVKSEASGKEKMGKFAIIK